MFVQILLRCRINGPNPYPSRTRSVDHMHHAYTMWSIWLNFDSSLRRNIWFLEAPRAMKVVKGGAMKVAKGNASAMKVMKAMRWQEALAKAEAKEKARAARQKAKEEAIEKLEAANRWRAYDDSRKVGGTRTRTRSRASRNRNNEGKGVKRDRSDRSEKFKSEWARVQEQPQKEKDQKQKAEKTAAEQKLYRQGYKDATDDVAVGCLGSINDESGTMEFVSTVESARESAALWASRGLKLRLMHVEG